MKKVISLVLSVMMMLTMFAGCKASGTAETAAPTSSTAAETSADTTPAVQEFNVAIVQQLDHASLDEIRTAILAEIDRGVTVLHGEGGYTGEPSEVLLSVISNRELPRLEKLVHSIDPACFLIVSRVTEVSGRGFSMEKEYQ